MSRSRPLRLCFISNPQSIHTRRWLEWFAEHGHTVRLLADTPAKEGWTGIEIVDLTRWFNLRVLRFAAWGLWARRLVRDWKPDLLHAHRVSSAGWIGAFSGFHPFVISPWGSDLLQHPARSRLARFLATYVLRRADLVTVNSRALQQAAIRFGASPELIKPIQFGVNLQVFRPSPANPVLAQSLGVEGCRVVLSSRAVSPIYNLDTIVESIPMIREVIPEARFILFNYNVNSSYKTHLLQQIDELGETGAVRWAGPFRSQEDIAGLYNLADVIISVPSSDSTPSSLLEAMACGKPVIASDLPSMREWIDSGENGLIVPVRDPSLLAQAVIRLLSSPVERDRLATRSLQVVTDRADYHAEMQKMEDLYYALLEGHLNGS